VTGLAVSKKWKNRLLETLKWIFLIGIVCPAVVLLIVFAFTSITGSSDQEVVKKTVIEKKKKVAISFSSGNQKEIALVKRAAQLMKEQCFKGERWEDVVSASVTSRNAERDFVKEWGYEGIVEFTVKIGSELKHIPSSYRVNRHTCHLMMNRKLTKLGAHKEMCQKLCSIPLIEPGISNYVRLSDAD
jgi:hypothetical protein